MVYAVMNKMVLPYMCMQETVSSIKLRFHRTHPFLKTQVQFDTFDTFSIGYKSAFLIQMYFFTPLNVVTKTLRLATFKFSGPKYVLSLVLWSATKICNCCSDYGDYVL